MQDEQITTSSSVDLVGVNERLDIIISSMRQSYTLQQDQMHQIETIGTELRVVNENMELVETRIDVMYQASFWIILLLGLISGILFVLVFSGGKKK